MARRTTDKTAAANKRFARTQPLRTYQTKGGAQQYGSPEAFEKADELAFERYLRAVDDGTSSSCDDCDEKMANIQHPHPPDVDCSDYNYGECTTDDF